MSKLNPTYEGLTIDGIKKGFTGSIIVEWSCPQIGWGEFRIWWDPNEQLCMDTEFMSDEFVIKLLGLLAKEMKRCDD